MIKLPKHRYKFTSITIHIYYIIIFFNYSKAKMHSNNPMYGSISSPKDAYVRPKDIEAVEGKSVHLPCPITAPLQDVYMVLWFKDNGGIPLYSFDVRNKLLSEEPRHWSAPEVFGSRAKFNFNSSPSLLEIKDIKRHDQGIYRCRIDFRTSQTQSYRFNLSVIIVPEKPIILDRWGRNLNGTTLGPKQEGDDIVITCRVVGGRPAPQVRWLVNGLLVDNQYEHNSGDVIENRLLWPSVQRSDLNSIFTCQATNTDLDKPKEKHFKLDMHLKPLTVEIKDPPHSMIADKRYEVSCESKGSRPNAIITWYKGKRQLRRAKEEAHENTTKSILSFVPTTDDDGKTITCRSENPNVNGLFLETTWRLNIVYPPLVTLRLGSTLSSNDIKEGDDVYFECHVQANPQWRKLLWLHNGFHLEHNASARIIRSNQSLVLQKITKHLAGNYACSATNDEGETVSNQLPLQVQYTPICKHNERIVLIGASKDETVEISCEIQADPPPKSFRWKFNNSGETLEVGSERFSVNGSRSLLKYTPVNDQDYGTLSCWASNDVGVQKQPCLFQVVLASIPNPVINCSILNHTDMGIEIVCTAGYDGGLPQVFILEMFSSITGLVRYNQTNTDEPIFALENLDTLTTLMANENNSLKARVYALNQKGRSSSFIFKDFIIGSSSYMSENNDSLLFSPILLASILTILTISIVVVLKTLMVIQSYKNTSRQVLKSPENNICGIMQSNESVRKTTSQIEKPRWQHTESHKISVEDVIDDERDPDVIPSHYAVISGIQVGSPVVPKWSSSRPTGAKNTTSSMQNCLNSTNKPATCFKYNGYVGKSSHLTISSIISPISNVDNYDKTLSSEINFVSKACTKNNNDSPSSTTSTATIGNTPCEASTLKKKSLNGIKIISDSEKHIDRHKSDHSSYSEAIQLNSETSPSASLSNENILRMEGDRTYSKFITSTQGYSNENDIEDNININAIKDCLMNQRVPESCV
ncbi:hypothetical protein ACFFRR_005408 [Megaselia abdita]